MNSVPASARVSLSAIVTAGFLIATMALLALLPWQEPSAAVPVSVSQLEGFSNAIAIRIGVYMALLCGFCVFWLIKGATVTVSDPGPFSRSRSSTAATSLQVLVIFAVLLFLLFPPALARYGPFIEEGIHLSSIHRMLYGDVPYVDFVSLYGPLMLYPVLLWTEVFGFTLISFYSYVFVLEFLTALTVFLIIQTYVRNVWLRFLILGLLASILFNIMLGPNQNSLRRIAGLVLLLSVSHRPLLRPLWVLHGACVGLLLCYSQEFGVATAAGITAIYLMIAIKQKSAQAILGLFVIGGVSAVSWVGSAWLMLGPDTLTYYQEIIHLAQRYSAGEAAFPVILNVTTVAVLILLFLGVWQSGYALATPWTRPASAGDLIFVGGTAFALVMLKSGFNRADQWHLYPVVIVIIFAFVLPIPARNSPVFPKARYLAIATVIILAGAMTYGNYPHGSYVFRQNLKNGYKDILAGVPVPGDAGMVRRATTFQNSHPVPDFITLRDFLMAPEQEGRPVFTYGDSLSSVVFKIGIPVATPFTDDFIYDDSIGEESIALLDSSSDILVLMHRWEYEWLMTGPDAPPLPGRRWASDAVIARQTNIASVHFRASPLEGPLKVMRWRRLMGNYILERYTVIYKNDTNVVLERTKP